MAQTTVRSVREIQPEDEQIEAFDRLLGDDAQRLNWQDFEPFVLEHRRIINSGNTPRYREEPETFEETLDETAQNLVEKVGQYRKTTLKELFVQYMKNYQRLRTGSEEKTVSERVKNGLNKAYEAVKDRPLQTLEKAGRVAIGSGKYVYDTARTFFMGADQESEDEAEVLREVLADNDINPHLLVKEAYHVVNDEEGFEDDLRLPQMIDEEFERMAEEPEHLRDYLEQTEMHDGAIDMVMDRFEEVSGREAKKVVASSVIKFSSMVSIGPAALPIVLLADKATEAYEKGLRAEECEPLDGECDLAQHNTLKSKIKKHARGVKEVADQGGAKIRDSIGWFYDRLKAIPDGFRKLKDAAKKPRKLKAFLYNKFTPDKKALEHLDEIIDAVGGPGLDTFL